MDFNSLLNGLLAGDNDTSSKHERAPFNNLIIWVILILIFLGCGCGGGFGNGFDFGNSCGCGFLDNNFIFIIAIAVLIFCSCKENKRGCDDSSISLDTGNFVTLEEE